MKTEKKDLQLALANPFSVDGQGFCDYITRGYNNMLPCIDSTLFYKKEYPCMSDCILDRDHFITFSKGLQESLQFDTQEISQNSALFNLQKEIREDFTTKKLSSEILANTYEFLKDSRNDLSDRRIKRVWECANFLGFIPTETKYKLVEANFCRDRLCPQCQKRRSLKMFGQLSSILDYIVSDEGKKKFGSVRFGFATFTIRNCDFGNLSKAIDCIIDGFRKLTHDHYLGKKLFRSGCIAGVFRAIEVTFNDKENTWHPHLHCIFAFTPRYFEGRSGFYLRTAQWSKIWSDCIGSDYLPVCDIRMIKSYYAGHNVDMSPQVFVDVVKEVAKYSVKGSSFLHPGDLDLTRKKVYVLLDALSGRKLYGFTGCFLEARKHLQLDDIDNGNLIDTGNEKVNEEVVGIIRRFKWSGYGYSEY